MSRRQRERPLSQADIPEHLLARLRPPLAIALGSPGEILHVLRARPDLKPTCYQMDLFQTERLRAELAENLLEANVVASADLWDLPPEYQTVLYMPARGGERELKIDMVEQSFHILRPGGQLVVWSSYESDTFFSPQMKKVFGRVHAPAHDPGDTTNVLWSAREGERPRRRHEVVFQNKVNDRPACRFVSRPGTFSYGKFDLGARALCEVMEIEPGDRVLDLGSGVGTNGVFASQVAGPSGYVAFVDSNVRAVALSAHNAQANGVAKFDTFATNTIEGPQEKSFDVVLANPPYFANSSIAHLFIHRAKDLLTPQGRFFMVTRQPGEVSEVMLDVFEDVEAVEHRGYTILLA